MSYNKLFTIAIAFLILISKVFAQDNIESNRISYFEIINKYESLQVHENDEDISNLDPGSIEENTFLRWQWFWGNRVDENGYFKKYQQQLNSILMDETKTPVLKSLSLVHWSPLGPTSFPTPSCSYLSRSTGLTQVMSIWANNTDLFIGLNGGGLWKRDGTSWINLTDNTVVFGVSDIEVDSSGKIYLASGWDGQNGSEKADDVYGMGVIYSTDNGQTWVTDNMTNNPDADLYIEKILIDPNNQNIVYALSKKTLYKSIDGGNNWINMNPPVLSNKDWYVVWF